MHFALVLQRRAARRSESLKKRHTCIFNCLRKLHLSSEGTTAMELKRQHNIQEPQDLGNHTKDPPHKYYKSKHASVFSLSSAKHIRLRLLAQRSLQSPSLFQVYSQQQRNTLLRQAWTSVLNARRWHSHTYTCTHMPRFQFDTRLLNPFLFSLIRNKCLQLKDCKELPDPTKHTCCLQKNSL